MPVFDVLSFTSAKFADGTDVAVGDTCVPILLIQDANQKINIVRGDPILVRDVTAPTNLAAVTVSAGGTPSTEITFGNLNAISDNVGVATIEVLYGTTAVSGAATSESVVPVTNNEYTVSGLAPDTTYYCWTRVTDAAGNISGPTPVSGATITTAIAAAPVASTISSVGALGAYPSITGTTGTELTPNWPIIGAFIEPTWVYAVQNEWHTGQIPGSGTVTFSAAKTYTSVAIYTTLTDTEAQTAPSSVVVRDGTNDNIIMNQVALNKASYTSVTGPPGTSTLAVLLPFDTPTSTAQYKFEFAGKINDPTFAQETVRMHHIELLETDFGTVVSNPIGAPQAATGGSTFNASSQFNASWGPENLFDATFVYTTGNQWAPSTANTREWVEITLPSAVTATQVVIYNTQGFTATLDDAPTTVGVRAGDGTVLAENVVLTSSDWTMNVDVGGTLTNRLVLNLATTVSTATYRIYLGNFYNTDYYAASSIMRLTHIDLF